MAKWVYLFTEGDATMRNLLGGKGANLAEMTNIGLPVPQGFTITTEACTQYYEDGREINDEIQGQINEYIVKMEEITGKKFGDLENPLLVSVKFHLGISCPGRIIAASSMTKINRRVLLSRIINIVQRLIPRRLSIRLIRDRYRNGCGHVQHS